jgi:hypothetical protein
MNDPIMGEVMGHSFYAERNVSPAIRMSRLGHSDPRMLTADEQALVNELGSILDSNGLKFVRNSEAK